MKTFIILALGGFLIVFAFLTVVEEMCNISALKRFKKDPKSVPTKSGGFVINKKTKTVEEGANQPILPYPKASSLTRKLILVFGVAILGMIVFLW